MPHSSIVRSALPLLLAFVVPACSVQAQQGASPRAIAPQGTTAAGTELSAAEVSRLASLHVRLVSLQDSMNSEMAASRNKTPERQVELQGAFRAKMTELLAAAGLTPEEYQRRRMLVSSHGVSRQTFDGALVEMQASAAGRTAAAAVPAAPAVPLQEQPKMPAGPMGAHIGHVLVSFADTPDKVGLLEIAKVEAGIAAQHAGFAARTPTNLESMKRHAAHVLHAIDPAIEASGPGKGYGVKKAATGVATHIELAAKVESAPAGVRTHAEHVATAARSTVSRAEEIVALAQKIVAATTADDAAALVAQMASLAEQLTSGTDLNADGRINWGNGEGGLQQADEHMKLLLAVAVR
jgi:hypothetical protein